MENIKALNLSLDDNISNEKTDNEFEKFLWKRAKKIEKTKTENNTNFLSDIKRKLTPSETVTSISEEIEEYMVDYLRVMEFTKSHSLEISNFLKDNLLNSLNRTENKDLIVKLEKITTL